MKKIIWIVIAAFLFLLIVSGFSTYNRAISAEESVLSSKSDISVQEQRQFDLITKLVQVVKENAKYESGTLIEIVKQRKTLLPADVQELQTSLNLVVEQYPELKANESYIQLMTELSISANLISEHRKTYNYNIEKYRRFVKKAGASFVLRILGYDIVNFEYLDFGEIQLPDKLFG